MVDKFISAAAFILFVAVVVSVASCSPKKVEEGVSCDLARERQATIGGIRYQLHFQIPEERDAEIPASETVTFSLNERYRVVMDAKGFDIHSVVVNGDSIAAILENEHLIIPEGWVKEGNNEVRVEFTAGTQSLNRRDEFLYTLLVPDRARTLFPCFDQPDLKAVFSLSLSIPHNWIAVSNASICGIDSAEVADGRVGSTEVQFADTAPLSTYLFSFVAGKFSCVTDSSCVAGGKPIAMYHRETDSARIAQCYTILHHVKKSIEWLEEYTGIEYPFEKYDLVAIPDFQYGGMEHAGATLYNDKRIFLPPAPTADELYGQLSLIAHETAHMWFGDLVTMKWFNDVWIKEVFANFLAAKISSPLFQDLDHRIPNLRNYTAAAYEEDRTPGSNAIQRHLGNLKDAGLIYCNIIYDKSPLVMTMLEERVGSGVLREAVMEYLKRFSYGNAGWDELVEIINRKAGMNMTPWSCAWVKRRGMPHFSHRVENGILIVCQSDPFNEGTVWQEDVLYSIVGVNGEVETMRFCFKGETQISHKLPFQPQCIIPNIDAKAYGWFSVSDTSACSICNASTLAGQYLQLDDVGRMSLLMTLYENLRHGCIAPKKFNTWIGEWLFHETNPLIVASMLEYGAYSAMVQGGDSCFEKHLAELIRRDGISSQTALLAMRHLMNISRESNELLYRLWVTAPLSEKDHTELAYSLMLRYPYQYDRIRQRESERISNPDRKESFLFVSRSCSPLRCQRDEIFERILNLKDRVPEARATKVLSLLTDPIRGDEAVERIAPALGVLEDVQRYGDIFYPATWSSALLKQQYSPQAQEELERFISSHHHLNPLLMTKLQQRLRCEHKPAAEAK